MKLHWLTPVTMYFLLFVSKLFTQSKKHGKYAQFLVIYCEGTFRETLGVWKRYSDFSALANKVTHGHEKCSSVLTHMNPLAISDETDFEMLPNAVTSWYVICK